MGRIISLRTWHGVMALVWLLGGLGAFVAFARSRFSRVDENTAGLMLLLLICGWLLPAFVLAISGVRKGNAASQVCGWLVLCAFAVAAASPIWIGIILTNH